MSSESYVKIAELDELKEGEGKCVAIGDHQIALFKVTENEVCAIGNICPHQGGPLADGFYNAEECRVTCPLHAWDFNVRTGKRVGGVESVPSYKVRVVDNTIEVSIE